MKALSLALALVALVACTTTKPLSQSGHYIVLNATRDGSGQKVQLQGVDKFYFFPTDTLKVGDTVFVTFVKHYGPKKR